MQARFEQETKVQAAIGDSPYIVDVIDAGIDAKSGVPFLVMPLLKGQTLFERLQTGPLSWSEVSRCLGQLARAMDKAHAARVVHRDLKPSNLFLTIDDDGATVLKVLDFGIAKELVDEVQRTVTEVGTPAYAAPEQLAPAFKALAATRGIAIAGGSPRRRTSGPWGSLLTRCSPAWHQPKSGVSLLSPSYR